MSDIITPSVQILTGNTLEEAIGQGGFGNAQRADAAEGGYFARQLEHIIPEVWREKRPLLNAQKYIPMDQSVGIENQFITYRQYEHSGRAKFIGDKDQSVPSVNVHGAEKQVPYRTFAVALSYSYRESIAFSRKRQPANLLREQVVAARRAMDELVNYTTWFGDADRGIVGLFNSDVAQENSTVEIAEGTASAPDVVANYIAGRIQDVRVKTRGVEAVRQVVFGIVAWSYISQTQFDGRDYTILEWLRKNNPEVTFDWAQELDQVPNPKAKVDPSLPATISAMMLYTKNNMNLRTHVAPSKTLPLMRTLGGLKFTQVMHSAISSIITPYPQATRLVLDTGQVNLNS